MITRALSIPISMIGESNYFTQLKGALLLSLITSPVAYLVSYIKDIALDDPNFLLGIFVAWVLDMAFGSVKHLAKGTFKWGDFFKKGLLKIGTSFAMMLLLNVPQKFNGFEKLAGSDYLVIVIKCMIYGWIVGSFLNNVKAVYKDAGPLIGGIKRRVQNFFKDENIKPTDSNE